MLQRIKNKVNSYVWEKQHKEVRAGYQAHFSAEIPTIISCNCIGGVLYHELNLQFRSPTINLYMSCEDFIKFCERLEYYLNMEVTEYTGDIERSYPLGQLDDLVLYFVHYHSFEEAKQKWNERKQRVNLNRVFIIATDRDGFNQELLNRFLQLPYENKRLFSHLPIEEDEVVYIRGYESENQVEGLTYKTSGGHYLIDQFDWVSWLNGK